MSAGIVLVGRPNVGKSTLFNCLARARDALVADVPGMTRDRRYGVVDLGGRRATLVDTGGFGADADGLSDQVFEQALCAVQEAALAALVVDAVTGQTVEDRRLLDWLRALDKPLMLIVNKADGAPAAEVAAEFASLGVFRSQAVSALHGQGIAQLRAALAALLPDVAEPPARRSGPVVAVIGRPNVGKSTLVNRILGAQRVLTAVESGTTRDSVHVPFRRGSRAYTLVDTAGLRRRARPAGTAERLSALKALEAVHRADVALALINARDGVVAQDVQLLNYALDAGCGLVVALNQWDGLDAGARRRALGGLDHALRSVDFVDRRCISALTGEGVPGLFRLIDRVHASATAPLSTARLTRLVREACAERPPPMRRGHRPKLRYAHAGGKKPPVVVLHGAGADQLPAHYRQYLRRWLRQRLSLVGVPLRLEFVAGGNPYAERAAPRRAAPRRRARA